MGAPSCRKPDGVKTFRICRRRIFVRSAILLATFGLAFGPLFSCSPAPPRDPAHAPDPPPERPVNADPAFSSEASSDVDAAAARGALTQAADPTSSATAEDGGPSDCPDDMVLVEGEYCTAISNDHVADEHGNTPGAGGKDIEVVERECLKEWYAPQNKKRVCEEFSTQGRCTGKMVKKRFCIDRYAWPNKKGHKPEVMNRFYQAQVKCAAVGRRLCTESEWTFACEGPKMKPFPYGYVRDTNQCHGDEEWDSPNMTKVAQRDEDELRRLYKAEASGQPGCRSDFGVYDLPGNTDEVVASETFEAGWRGKYESVHTGGPWYKGVRNQCRPKIYTHNEGFYYYFLSFRCCADAGAVETDPRTPKQKAKGWEMTRVERLAGVSVEEMRAMLEKKKTDPTCGCKTTDCRTLCGTLLGDEELTKPQGQQSPRQDSMQESKSEKN